MIILKLARFPITENAQIEPGRELFVQHFHVGQYVDIVQRSVDYGEVDVVTRYHKKDAKENGFIVLNTVLIIHENH